MNNVKINKSNKFKRILSYLFIFIIPVLIATGSVYFYNSFIINNGQSNNQIIVNHSGGDNTSDSNDSSYYINELPSARNTYGNNYIMGKLEIPNLNINSYVTRASNNDYYLNYNLYNQYDQIGVPFFDYRNTNLNTDRQINIYGHNTKNQDIASKLPFTNLANYDNKDVFDTYKDIYLSIDERKVHYKVFAVKIIYSNSDNEHMKVIFYSDDDYINHVNKLLSNTLYKDDSISIGKDDRLLVLQVCYYNPSGSYLLVIGKEV